jgi:hypothetical protein
MSETATIEARLRRFAAAPDDADWLDVLRRAGPPTRSEAQRRHPRLTRRRLVAAVVVAIALVVATVAVAGRSLFGISNHGTRVHTGRFVLAELNGHAWLRGKSGLPAPDIAKSGTFVQLALRQGIGVYAARSKANSSLCFFLGHRWSLRGQPPHRLYLGGPGCYSGGAGFLLPERLQRLSMLRPGRKAEARVASWLRAHPFPSPARPVFDMSGEDFLRSRPYGAWVSSLVGVTANGVRSIQLLALADCHPVVTVPVINNVYIDAKPPAVAEAFLVARDASGKVIWHSARSYMAVPKLPRIPLERKAPRNCGFR